MQPTTLGLAPQANPITVSNNLSGSPGPGQAMLSIQFSPGIMDFTGGLNPTTLNDDPLWPVQGDKPIKDQNGNVIGVQPGDYLEVQGGGLMYRIVSVTPSKLFLDRAPATPMAVPTAQYRIIRQPRVLAGETTLKLPQDVAIDASLTWKIGGGPGGQYTDIMFAPSGRVLNPPGVDKIILWVRDYTLDSPTQNEPVLISISVQNGYIAAHPVNLSDTTLPPSPTNNVYYNFALDPLGRSSGL